MSETFISAAGEPNDRFATVIMNLGGGAEPGAGSPLDEAPTPPSAGDPARVLQNLDRERGTELFELLVCTIRASRTRPEDYGLTVEDVAGAVWLVLPAVVHNCRRFDLDHTRNYIGRVIRNAAIGLWRKARIGSAAELNDKIRKRRQRLGVVPARGDPVGFAPPPPDLSAVPRDARVVRTRARELELGTRFVVLFDRAFAADPRRGLWIELMVRRYICRVKLVELAALHRCHVTTVHGRCQRGLDRVRGYVLRNPEVAHELFDLDPEAVVAALNEMTEDEDRDEEE
jgi:DNA-directed RNA polymerase specialized sigma24 family protein